MLKNKNILNRIYSFILLFCYICLSRNTLISTDIVGFKVSYYIILIISLPLIIEQIICIIKNKKISCLLSIMLISSIISIVLKLDMQPLNFSILSYIIIAYCYIKKFEKKDIIWNFIIIMTFLMIYSLIGEYIIKPALLKKIDINECIEMGKCFRNSSSTPFLNLIFSFPLYATIYIRNYSIFTEPAYYQFYLFILLSFLLFEKSINIKMIFRMILTIICVISILSTFSTAAFIILPIIILAFIYNLITCKKYDIKRILLFSFLIVLFSCILYKGLIINNYKMKYMIDMIEMKLTQSNSSTNTRTFNIINGLKTFIKSPIIGSRITDVVSNNNMVANTNISFLQVYGFIPGFVLLLTQYLFTLTLSKKRITRILIFITILLSINDHIFTGCLSFWIIILLGLNNEDLLWKKINKERVKKNEVDVDC